MIPDTLELETTTDTEAYESPPSLTYRMDFVNKRIIGKVDDSDAVMQFIHKVMNTDKYAYEIYDWYYGNEISSLIGKPYDYVVTECPRIIDEALTVDDRILKVTDFTFKRLSIDSAEISCVVKTIYGDLMYTKEMMI